MSSSAAPPAAQQPGHGILGRPYRRLTLGIVSVVLLIAFEGMAVATAMPVAVRDLEGLSLYAWSFSGYFAASLYSMVVAGEWCDRRGPKRPILVGSLTFVGGLVLAGLAPSMWPFIAGRAIQGFGGGLVIVALYVVVARAYPDALRPRVFAALSAAWVVPAIVGPSVAGAVAERASWRLVFVGLVPLVIPALLLVLPGLHRYADPANTRRRGRTWLAAAAAAGVASLQYAGVRLDPFAVLVAVAGCALIAVSVPRLLPVGTLRFRRGLPTVVAMRGVLAGAFFGAESFLPLMLVQERHVSVTYAGLALTCGALGWAMGSWYQGRPGLTVPRYRLIQAGTAFVAFGIVTALLVLIPEVPVAMAIVAWTIGALGMGLAMSSISVLIFEYSPPADQGANSAAVQLADALGGIMCIGLGGVIFAFAHARNADVVAFVIIFGAMAVLATVGAGLGGRAGPARRQIASPGGAPS